MKYCATCVTPYNRPNISFDAEGRCNCAGRAQKDAIDWVAREADFRAVVEHAKARTTRYDCVIPVSGGKDSTWQVVKCLEYGLRPLCVTWRPPGRTEIGQRNLENLIQLGVDHIDWSISPAVEKKFTYLSLKKYGTNALPMHMAIFAIPLNVAVRFDIPLVIWGENSAFEYGGTEEARRGFQLDSAWLKKHGVTHGTTAKDWVGAPGEEGGLTERELAPYFGPSDAELAQKGTNAIFLGYYFRWDPNETARIAEAHGFRRGDRARTGLYDFADIDDDFISIHHWLKWYKFGFTRSFDNLSLEIRNGRLSREEAIATLRRRGDETPHEDIAKLCAWLGITKEHFYELIEPFRSTEVWKRRDGKWVIDDFLIPEWSWT